MIKKDITLKLQKLVKKKKTSIIILKADYLKNQSKNLYKKSITNDEFIIRN
ncbi:MAG: hypothetical protein V5A68_05355 [Candidatus Thermoplasmatota archaeon]